MGNQRSQNDDVIVLSQPIRGGGFGANKKSVFLIRIKKKKKLNMIEGEIRKLKKRHVYNVTKH